MASSPALSQPDLAGPSESRDGGRRLPFGVYVVALLQALNAIGHGAGVVSGLEDRLIASSTRTEGEGIAIAVMTAGLAVAIGLLMLKRWAWVATMLWVGAAMAAELVLYFRGDQANYIVMALSLGQVLYLNLSDVQGAFERPRTKSVSP